MLTSCSLRMLRWSILEQVVVRGRIKSIIHVRLLQMENQGSQYCIRIFVEIKLVKSIQCRVFIFFK